MSLSARLSIRSLLAAGVSAAVVGTAVVTPVALPGPAPAMAISPAILLSAALEPFLQPARTHAPPQPAAANNIAIAPNAVASATSISNAIINAYDFVEPWVAYGFELAQYALSFVPGLWWVAPAIDLVYFTAEPLVQAGVYSFAYLIDGQADQIGPTIQTGVQQSVNNLVVYSIAWFASIVPLPPLPPFPIFPGASASTSPGTSLVGRMGAAQTAGHVTNPAATSMEAPLSEPSAGSTAPAELSETTQVTDAAPHPARQLDRRVAASRQFDSSPAQQIRAGARDQGPDTVVTADGAESGKSARPARATRGAGRDG